MTDLKTLAYELLHEAQQSLESEGHLNPTAVVITANENLIVDVEFEDDEEREDIYAELVETARDKNAEAILTINDVFMDDNGAAVRLQGPGWGDLRQPSNEAIVITVSGGGFETWSVVSSYYRVEEQFIFQPAREVINPGGEVELLGDWTGKTGAA
jgi:hypothetical protein